MRFHLPRTLRRAGTPAAAFLLLAAMPIAPAARAAPPAGAGADMLRGGLKYLASHQNADGSWFIAPGTKDRSSVAATSYGMLALVAAGSTHQQGEYAKNVAAGLKFLLDHAGDDGFIKAGATNMYDQGIATEVLAELYHQTKEEAIKPKLEAAVKLIVKAQGQLGAWGYAPVPRDGDLSVTGFEVASLLAARKAGVDVPQATIDLAAKYLLKCQVNGGGFTYMIESKVRGYARTAAAVHSLLLLGKAKDDPAVVAGVEFLRRSARNDDQWFAYAQYYIAGIHQMLADEDPATWTKRTTDRLWPRMERKGDEVVFGPLPDGDGNVGPNYFTAIYAIILAMPQGHLTLYEK